MSPDPRFRNNLISTTLGEYTSRTAGNWEITPTSGTFATQAGRRRIYRCVEMLSETTAVPRMFVPGEPISELQCPILRTRSRVRLRQLSLIWFWSLQKFPPVVRDCWPVRDEVPSPSNRRGCFPNTYGCPGRLSFRFRPSRCFALNDHTHGEYMRNPQVRVLLPPYACRLQTGLPAFVPWQDSATRWHSHASAVRALLRASAS